MPRGLAAPDFCSLTAGASLRLEPHDRAEGLGRLGPDHPPAQVVVGHRGDAEHGERLAVRCPRQPRSAAVAGVAVGFVPSVAYVSRLPGYTVDAPWPTLGLIVVAVPLVAAALAVVLARSRLPWSAARSDRLGDRLHLAEDATAGPGR